MQVKGPDGRLMTVPASVAIVAMGASNATYLALAANHGHRKEVSEETWAINAMAPLIQHDRAFVMDDVRHELVGQSRERQPRKVAYGILDWLQDHPGPVYTTTAYDEWPALVEYPIAAVAESVGGLPYMNNSVAYAVAYALHLHATYGRPKTLNLFGCDFVYPGPENRAKAEAGRACVEFLLGIGVARGMDINVPDTSTLLDGHLPDHERLYGYHEPVVLRRGEDGRLRLLRGEEARPTPTTISTSE